MSGSGKGLPDDPIRLRSTPLYRFFARIMRRQMRRGFHAVRVANGEAAEGHGGAPLVVYANHPSWWDPPFLLLLHDRFFGERRAFGAIDLDALERYRFMARIGLFGVERGTRAGARRFLKVAGAVLAEGDTILWLTPEGGFTDPRRRPLDLRPGLAHLVHAAPPETVFLPLAVEYPFWTERYPEALARFGEPLRAGDLGPLGREAAAERLRRGLEATMDSLAALAVARDAGAFQLLLEGSAGVGGVYDLWRRLKAGIEGRRFEPGHGEG
ncbi:MAG: lysophospholipid acyltransferase family protein [Geminicoccaceae bacterium]|nr:lysophospholipid acyltransferase family protein [Geminicoccaceae bacterium]